MNGSDRNEFDEVRFRTADGVEIVGDVGGNPEGDPVVLLHGGGQTRHSWGGAMRELIARGYHVVNYDARGHGDSGWSPGGVYTLQILADDLATVAGMFDRPAVLIGASMGGITSLEFVGNHPPSAARALVLVDIVPRPDPVGGQRIINFMQANPEGFARLEDAADAVAAYYPERPRPKDVSGLMKNLRRHDDGRLYWHWDPRFLQMRDRLEPPNQAERLLEAARKVKIPTLLARGQVSDIVNDAGVEELRACIPDLEVFDVAGAGHMVAGDKNDIFTRGVVDFLNRHAVAH